MKLEYLVPYLRFKLKGTYNEYLDKFNKDLVSTETEELIGINFEERRIYTTFGKLYIII